MVLKKLEFSKAHIDYSEKYNIDSLEWEYYYQFAHQQKQKNKIIEFQYKILNKYLPTNKLLFAMKKVDSPRCNFCFLYTQTISHLFFECLCVRNLWQFLKEQVRQKLAFEIELTVKNILFGIQNEENNDVINKINKIILQLKYFIFKQKLADSNISIQKATQYLFLNCEIGLFE